MDAYRLRCTSLILIQKIMTILLYVLTAICGILIIIAFINAWQHPEDRNAVKSLFVVLFNILPFDILAFCWVIILKIYVPFMVRRHFRKVMDHHGENFVHLSPEGVSEKSSMGSNSSYPWTVCSHWRESKKVIVILLQSGIYFLFPKACLSTAQQNELRGILTAALPKK